MLTLAIPEDVASRLGRSLSDAEATQASHLLEEASALVVSYLGGDPTAEGFVPDEVVIVTSRMVARVIAQSEADVPPLGVESVTDTSGPFSFTARFTDGSTSGGPWLAQADKLILRRFRIGGGIGSVPAASFHTGRVRSWR